MTHTLSVPDGELRVIGVTTTAKLAKRILCTSRVIANHLPREFVGSPAIDILLALHVAEDGGMALTDSEIDPPGALSAAITRRWIAALASRGLVDRRDDLLALSATGRALVEDLLRTVFAVQRSLDEPVATIR